MKRLTYSEVRWEKSSQSVSKSFVWINEKCTEHLIGQGEDLFLTFLLSYLRMQLFFNLQTKSLSTAIEKWIK